MLRTRLIGASLLTLTFLPGCGILCGDRPGLFERCRERRERESALHAMPVSYPVVMGDCGTATGGATIIPGGIPPGHGLETLPPPGTGEPPLIPRGALDGPGRPKAGVKESPGKQLELEPSSRNGPVLTMPAVRH